MKAIAESNWAGDEDVGGVGNAFTAGRAGCCSFSSQSM